ncbi:leucine-rich repeat domain-containing protein [Paraburkholderia bonniea]|uniref:leucine-rich repeat domain-containing protein n=1 Tax=Paraburkholderia bonniea TaxID=2152891 RepID=UPI001291391A|nr:leucine-rich repeat domain-containing protein [Paraburkholderia bonniea]WJF90871.1 leucine-rich repeat domain-containing protein [Paraburkholderia bonniea]WJF94186.1 leucine-rich repeat domain-containing protein [Paraburkholderia bonniea]
MTKFIPKFSEKLFGPTLMNGLVKGSEESAFGILIDKILSLGKSGEKIAQQHPWHGVNAVRLMDLNKNILVASGERVGLASGSVENNWKNYLKISNLKAQFDKGDSYYNEMDEFIRLAVELAWRDGNAVPLARLIDGLGQFDDWNLGYDILFYAANKNEFFNPLQRDACIYFWDALISMYDQLVSEIKKPYDLERYYSRCFSREDELMALSGAIFSENKPKFRINRINLREKNDLVLKRLERLSSVADHHIESDMKLYIAVYRVMLDLLVPLAEKGLSNIENPHELLDTLLKLERKIKENKENGITPLALVLEPDNSHLNQIARWICTSDQIKVEYQDMVLNLMLRAYHNIDNKDNKSVVIDLTPYEINNIPPDIRQIFLSFYEIQTGSMELVNGEDAPYELQIDRCIRHMRAWAFASNIEPNEKRKDAVRIIINFISKREAWELNLSSLGLKEFPPGFERLLDLSTILTVLRKSSFLRNLYYKKFRLDISDNLFSAFPAIIGKMVGLSDLDISGNRINMEYASFKNNTYLDRLAMDGMGLSSIPDCVIETVGLVYLSLGNNKMVDIRKDIFNLVNLKEFWIGGNLIVDLPDSFSGLQNLEIVGLENNRVIDVPVQLVNLDKLLRIIIGGNNIDGNKWIIWHEKYSKKLESRRDINVREVKVNLFHDDKNIFHVNALNEISRAISFSASDKEILKYRGRVSEGENSAVSKGIPNKIFGNKYLVNKIINSGLLAGDRHNFSLISKEIFKNNLLYGPNSVSLKYTIDGIGNGVEQENSLNNDKRFSEIVDIRRIRVAGPYSLKCLFQDEMYFDLILSGNCEDYDISDFSKFPEKTVKIDLRNVVNLSADHLKNFGGPTALAAMKLKMPQADATNPDAGKDFINAILENRKLMQSLKWLEIHDANFEVADLSLILSKAGPQFENIKIHRLNPMNEAGFDGFIKEMKGVQGNETSPRLILENYGSESRQKDLNEMLRNNGFEQKAHLLPTVEEAVDDFLDEYAKYFVPPNRNFNLEDLREILYDNAGYMPVLGNEIEGKAARKSLENLYRLNNFEASAVIVDVILDVFSPNEKLWRELIVSSTGIRRASLIRKMYLVEGGEILAYKLKKEFS